MKILFCLLFSASIASGAITNRVEYGKLVSVPPQILSGERYAKLMRLRGQVRCVSSVVTNGVNVRRYVTSERSWTVTNKSAFVSGREMRDRLRERVEELTKTNSDFAKQVETWKSKLEAEKAKTASALSGFDSLEKKFPLARSLIESIKSKLNGD